MDAVVSLTTAECDNEGCGRYVTYELDDHRSACPNAPCRCQEPGYGFIGLVPGLLGHLITLHSMPVQKMRYGKVLPLQVSASLRPWWLLLWEDDHAFLLVGGAHGPGAAVSVVCIRAEASPWPRYPPLATTNRKADTVLADVQVTSSTAPGDIAVEELVYLAVPPKLLVGAGAPRRIS